MSSCSKMLRRIFSQKIRVTMNTAAVHHITDAVLNIVHSDHLGVS